VRRFRAATFPVHRGINGQPVWRQAVLVSLPASMVTTRFYIHKNRIPGNASATPLAGWAWASGGTIRTLTMVCAGEAADSG